MSADHFITEFPARSDKVSSLNMDVKLKGHILLQRACLSLQDRNIVIGSTSCNYSVICIISAIRKTFRSRTPYDSTLVTTTTNSTAPATSSQEAGRPCQNNNAAKTNVHWTRPCATRHSHQKQHKRNRYHALTISRKYYSPSQRSQPGTCVTQNLCRSRYQPNTTARKAITIPRAVSLERPTVTFPSP